MKAWTKRLKAQYSSSFSSYHCCQELQKWAPPAQDHDCLLPWQLCTNPSIWTQGTEPKHTPFPHWEFFTQQSWIGKSCPIKDLKKKKRKRKRSCHYVYYDLCKYFPLALGICVISPTLPHASCWKIWASGEPRLSRVEFEVLRFFMATATVVQTSKQIIKSIKSYPFKAGAGTSTKSLRHPVSNDLGQGRS